MGFRFFICLSIHLFYVYSTPFFSVLERIRVWIGWGFAFFARIFFLSFHLRGLFLASFHSLQVCFVFVYGRGS